MIIFSVRLFGAAWLTHKRHVPFCFPNKVAYARAGAHILLTTEFFIRSLVIDVCLVGANLATTCVLANDFHL